MPNGMPYGDAFIVGTPALDQLSNRIYAEHQQRELQRRQDNKMLDEEFSRNLSGIWDADIPELTQKYGEYKQAWQNLYKKKGGGTPQEQLEVLKKKADMYSLLGKSKEHRNWWESKVKTVQSDKKGMFADDAATQLASIRGVPSAKADRTTIEGKLMYPYSLPEFDKWNKSSFGTPIERRGKQTISANDPLKDETPVWKVGNTPNQMFENLLNTVVTKNAGKNFTGLVLNSMDDQQKQDLTNRFIAKVKDPKFIAAYGEVQPFNQTALSTDLGEAVALQTMRNFVDLPIPEPKIESVINADRAKTRSEKFAKEQQARNHAASLQRLRESIAAGRIPWMNATQTASYVIDADKTVGENQPVKFDLGKYETITGGVTPSLNSELRSDGNGGYIYGIKNTQGEFIEKGRVDAVTAQDRLTKEAAKNKVENPAIKTPKPKEETVAERMRRLAKEKK